MRRIFLHFLSRRQRKSVKRRKSYFDVCTSGLGFAFLLEKRAGEKGGGERKGREREGNVSYLTSASTIIPLSVFRLTDPGVFSLNGKRGAKRAGSPSRTLAWFINAIVNDPPRPYNVISILTIEDRATQPETIERAHIIIFTSKASFCSPFAITDRDF